MTSDTSYVLEVSRENIEKAIRELSALDDSAAGEVVLAADNGFLKITRKSSNKETAQTVIDALGYFPFSVQCKWERFSLLSTGKSHAIQIMLRLNSKGTGTIKFDDMVIPYEPLSQQFSLPFASSVSAIEGTKELSEIDLNRFALQERLKYLDAQTLIGGAPIDAIARIYERDAEVVRIIKFLRGSACQICGHSFLTTSGGQYSECHHLAGLANMGLDVSRNILVLCANHHRQFHYGDVEILDHTSMHVRFRMDNKEFICKVGID